MKILGLTGDIACGKSTVARLLVAQGAEHLDSDLLVRELYADPEFASRLAARFGAVLDEHGAVDRQKLAPLVLNSPDVLRELETLVHPAVAELRARKFVALRESGVRAVVIEAVKLLESEQGNGCDALWCVVCEPAIQLRRLAQDRGFSIEAAQLRLQNQPSRAEKQKLAADVPLIWIPNNGTLAELEALVNREWYRFCQNF